MNLLNKFLTSKNKFLRSYTKDYLDNKFESKVVEIDSSKRGLAIIRTEQYQLTEVTEGLALSLYLNKDQVTELCFWNRNKLGMDLLTIYSPFFKMLYLYSDLQFIETYFPTVKNPDFYSNYFIKNAPSR